MAFDWSQYAIGGATRPDSFTGMDDGFRSSLEALFAEAPPELGLQVGSGYRSVERQRQLWEASDKTGRTVARPGRSQHNHGRAADLSAGGVRLDKASPEARAYVHENAARYGLHFPMSWEPWHIEPIGARGGGGGEVHNHEQKLDMGQATMAGYPARAGGLGGLGGMPMEEPQPEGIGGFLNSSNGGDLLQAIGMSLMSSPSNNPLGNVASLLPDMQARSQKREDERGDRRSIAAALQYAGLSPEEAWAYSANPSAANLVIQAKGEQDKIDRAAAVQAGERSFLAGLGGGGMSGDIPTGEGLPDPLYSPAPMTSGSDIGVSPPRPTVAADRMNYGPQMPTAAPTLGGAVAAAEPAAAEPATTSIQPSTFATGNKTVDALLAERARLVDRLANAPTDDAFQRGKLRLDDLDKKIDQYTPTSEVKEYDFSMRQRMERGEPVISFDQWGNERRKAGATVVTTGSDSGQFYKTADEKRANQFAGLSDEGVNAQRRLIQIDQLDGLLSNVETGGMAAFKRIAGEYGIATEGLSDIQAASSLIDQMVPSQRPPGSGTMSDADLALFKQSLPRLINQPGGNALIIETLRGIANYDRAVGTVADRVLDRELTPAQGREAIANIENPLVAFRKRTQASDQPARPMSDDDFAKLPSGALFVDPDDGKTYRKP